MYKRFQIYRKTDSKTDSGWVGICEVDTKTGRMVRSVCEVLEGFSGNMERVQAALDVTNRKRKSSYAPFLNEAIDALHNRP